MEELNCNIVVMRQQEPEVLRLSLSHSPETETSCELEVPLIRGPVVTPASSPEESSPLTRTEAGTASISSLSDPEASPFTSSTRPRRSVGLDRPLDESLKRTYKDLLESLSKLDREPDVGVLNYR